jgi:hypothetical protein
LTLQNGTGEFILCVEYILLIIIRWITDAIKKEKALWPKDPIKIIAVNTNVHNVHNPDPQTITPSLPIPASPNPFMTATPGFTSGGNVLNKSFAGVGSVSMGGGGAGRNGFQLGGRDILCDRNMNTA